MDWLTPEVVEAVCRHMNDDHAGDNVVICRGVGGHRGVETATMTTLDVHGVEFATTGGDAPPVVRIEFAEPVADRSQVRTEVVRMFRESCELLGITPE